MIFKPCHSEGSACGAGLSGKPTSTMAAERRWIRLLSLSREDVVRFNQGRAP